MKNPGFENGVSACFLVQLQNPYLKYRQYYHPHCTDEETARQSLNNLPKVVQLVHGEARLYTQICVTSQPEHLISGQCFLYI